MSGPSLLTLAHELFFVLGLSWSFFAFCRFFRDPATTTQSPTEMPVPEDGRWGFERDLDARLVQMPNGVWMCRAHTKTGKVTDEWVECEDPTPAPAPVVRVAR